MTNTRAADEAITAVLNAYPSLRPADAAVFLQVCADDGISLKSLARRLDMGQSMVSRHITALAHLEPGQDALVEVRAATADALRRTAHLTDLGRRMCAEIGAVDEHGPKQNRRRLPRGG